MLIDITYEFNKSFEWKVIEATVALKCQFI